MQSPTFKYAIERWPFGWLVCAPSGRSGIPMNALSECSALFPRGAIMEMGIPHHFQASGRPEVVACVAAPADAARWRSAIESELARYPEQERWWRGLDVGRSSATIFSVFCDSRFQHAARELGGGATPLDADDFGRCSRLLSRFPQWRAGLSRVASAFPESKWPAIVPRWADIEAAAAPQQTAILRELN